MSILSILCILSMLIFMRILRILSDLSVFFLRKHSQAYLYYLHACSLLTIKFVSFTWFENWNSIANFCPTLEINNWVYAESSREKGKKVAHRQLARWCRTPTRGTVKKKSLKKKLGICQLRSLRFWSCQLKSGFNVRFVFLPRNLFNDHPPRRPMSTAAGQFWCCF